MRTVVTLVAVALLVTGCGTSGDDSTGTPTPSPSPTATVTVTASPTPSSVATSGQAATPAATCGSFGTTTEQSSDDPLAMSSLFGETIRVGTHDCFDRFVLQLQGTGPEPGWTVGYRDPLVEDPSGRIVDLRGDAELEVIVRAWTVAPYPDMPTEWLPFEGPTRILPADYPVLREVRYLSSFEGVTQFGIGVDRRHPFRVMWLHGPDRLVVDIAHR